MIKDLLPAYYQAFGMNPTHEIVESIVIDGHEVAWMKYVGTVVHDITGRGAEGKTFSGFELCCECCFTKGVAWDIGKDKKPYMLAGDPESGVPSPENCLHRQEALRLRHLALHKEYKKRFSSSLENHIPEIVMDVIKKVKAGEFVEDGAGAGFYGGYFYVQTIRSILGDIKDSMKLVWESVREMQDDKKITLEDSIVTKYRAPPPPEWSEHLRVRNGDWIGVAYLPAHSRMEQVWELEAFQEDDYLATKQGTTLPLRHSLLFGPDNEDIDHGMDKLTELIEEAKEKAKK